MEVIMKTGHFFRIMTIAAFAFLSSTSFAASDSASASGFVHYEKDSELVTRNVTMRMERTDDEQARFTFSAGSWSIESTQAFIRESRGARVAYVGFENAWTMDGKSTHLLFKGIKLGGEADMVYQGTLYKTTPEQLAMKGESLEECLQKIRDGGVLDEDWDIAGTFYFKK